MATTKEDKVHSHHDKAFKCKRLKNLVEIPVTNEGIYVFCY